VTGSATLITGASRGIGRALADKLAADGETVVGLSRRRPAEGFPGDYYEADLADQEALAEALAAMTAAHSVTRVVNNAGALAAAELSGTTLDGFNTEIAVNLRAALQCVQACLPEMRKRETGRIVNIATRAILGRVKRTGYAAAKMGLVGFTRTWALELAPFGITVNAIAPGPIATEMFLTNMPPGSPEYERVLSGIPLRRMGKPEEVAATIAFFLSDAASFVTGQTLFVCGGGSIGKG
jgi:NAD(P)-dependent dehydrogenase (short-subunit alcohol dehydrogenase family)